MVILAVADDAQSAFAPMALGHLLEPHRDSVVERRVAARSGVCDPAHQRLAAARALQRHIRSIAETDQRVFVILMPGLNETGERVSGALNLSSVHRAGEVEYNRDRRRAVIQSKETDLLRNVVLEDGEGGLVQAGEIAPLIIHHSD